MNQEGHKVRSGSEDHTHIGNDPCWNRLPPRLEHQVGVVARLMGIIRLFDCMPAVLEPSEVGIIRLSGCR